MIFHAEGKAAGRHWSFKTLSLEEIVDAIANADHIVKRPPKKNN
jgi:hypothetical protein